VKDRAEVIYDSIIGECTRLRYGNVYQGDTTVLARRLADMVEAGLRAHSATVELHALDPTTFVTVHAASMENRLEAQAIIQKSTPDGTKVLALPADTEVHAHDLPVHGILVVTGLDYEDAEAFRRAMFDYAAHLKSHGTTVNPLMCFLPTGTKFESLSGDDLDKLGLRRK
jgi:hypothetical protein